MARVEAPSLRTRTAARRNPGDVFLRPLRMSDRDCVRRWMAEPAVIRFTVQVPGPEFGPVVPYSDAEADRYLELLVRDPDRRSWAIELDGVHVGNVGLKGHDWPKRTAECFIEIGELGVRGRGVGEAAMTQLLDRAFGDVGLLCVRLGVFEFNEPAINLYKKLGFVDDGRHGSHYVDGRTWTVNAMTLDAARWRARAFP
jgi:RimJ/RimL family protein N-acetyltransferase